MKLQLNIVWNTAGLEPLDLGHADALRESGIARATEMIMQGYTSGELTDSVLMHETDPEDGVHYRGWWSLVKPTELVSIPDDWELVPEDLVTHLNDWREACAIAQKAVQIPCKGAHLDTVAHWQLHIDLLNKIEWEISRSALDQEAIEIPKGWRLAPKSLKARLAELKKACSEAEKHSPEKDQLTHADDKAYWVKQVRVIERIEALLKAEEADLDSQWIRVTEALPEIPANHIRGERPYLVRTSEGEVLPAHLIAGRPLYRWDALRICGDCANERHWVALEGEARTTIG